MSLLGLELSDAGILVAASGSPGLLQIDGSSVESPGFALPEKNRLSVGKAAQGKAHLYPRQVLNHFWDRLNIEPLEQPNPFAHNHAEIAFEHFSHIWKTVKHHGTEMRIAVPGFYTPEHLGLILGIARELSISVKGFVPLPLVAALDWLPQGLVLHIDMHLHRFEITCLQRKGQISQLESVSSEGNGLSNLYRGWVDAIAEEFVRSTRFDPLHQAATEQELYDRLPGVLNRLNRSPSVDFEMAGGSKVYHVTLTRRVFYKKGAPVFEEIRRRVGRFYERYGKAEPGPVVLLTDRAVRLPGMKDALAAIENCQIIDLQPGAGAMGILRLSDQLFERQSGSSAPFLRTLPMPAADPISYEHASRKQPAVPKRPTHILYRNLAYPITEKPLVIGLEPAADKSGIQIRGQVAGVSPKHCTVQSSGNDIVLHDHSRYGTFVDEKPVNGKIILSLGQTIGVGTPREELKLIACVNTDET